MSVKKKFQIAPMATRLVFFRIDHGEPLTCSATPVVGTASWRTDDGELEMDFVIVEPMGGFPMLVQEIDTSHGRGVVMSPPWGVDDDYLYHDYHPVVFWKARFPGLAEMIDHMHENYMTNLKRWEDRHPESRT